MTNFDKQSANSENAKGSTGPKAEIGKPRASGNSTEHSLFARELFVDEAERGRFEELRSAFYEQLSPSTPLQQIKFDHVLTCASRLRAAILFGGFRRRIGEVNGGT
jgi:hypothetical protein